MANGEHNHGDEPRSGGVGDNQSGGSPHQPPAKTTGPSGGGTGGIQALLTEGWGAGGSTIDELKENLGRVFETVKGPLLYAFLGVAGVSLLISEFVAVMQAVFTWAAGGFGALVAALFSLVAFGVIFLLGFLNVALFSPLRNAALEGRSYSGPIDVLREAGSRYGWVMLAIFGVLLVQLLTICVPGAAIILLSPVPYLVATRPELPMGDAFKMGFTWFKRHFLIILVAYAVSFGVVLLLGCPLGLLQWGASMVLPSALGAIMTSFVGWAVITTLNFLFFVLIGTVLLTIDTHESGATL